MANSQSQPPSANSPSANSPSAILDHALSYAGRGWRVLPLHGVREGGKCACGKDTCQSPGKHPRNANGVKEATTNLAVIRAWWQQWPGSNVGIATGLESGLVVLDIDPRHGGDDSLRDLLKLCGPMPDTVESRTGGGGWHVLFKHPGVGRIPNKAGISPGLDIRGDGGYIVAPPSAHASGSPYAWDLMLHPDDVDLAPMPDWLLQVIRLEGYKVATPQSSNLVTIPEGQRHTTLVSLAGAMRRKGMSQGAIEVALLAENAARCSPPLEDDEVKGIAASIAKYDPPGDKQYAVSTTPVPVWEQDEPEERRWVIEGLVPDGALTILYGDGGQGKSLLAVYLATLVCLGRSFMGRMVEARSALYVDAELEQSEMVRRAYWVARGMGLQMPPRNLYYYRLPGPLSHPAVQDGVLRAIQTCGAGFCILDSLTIGAYGEGMDINAAGDVTSVLKGIEEWGPVVAIDHVPKPAPGANLSQYRPFGSAFKYNLARSVIQLVKAEGGAVTARQSKNNFGRLSEPLHLIMEFGEVEQFGGNGRGTWTRFDAVRPDDPRLAGMEEHLPAIERVYKALVEHGANGATPESLSEPLEMAPKTIRNHLSALRHQGRVTPKGDNVWQAA